MRRPMRRARTIVVALAVGLVLLCLCVAVDALFIEPYDLEVTRHTIEAPIPAPLTIAHVTDLHTRGLGRLERDLVAAIERERPDAIVVTGDTNTPGSTFDEMRAVLERLRAPLGAWAVRGNHEIWKLRGRDRELYESSGLRYLENEAAELAPGVWIVGLDEAVWGRPDPSAFDRAPRDAFRIALFHSPVAFDALASRCDLAFAGHTHGGQIRPPLLPVSWLPRGTGPYLEGWYAREGARMYVSRGLGTTGPPARFRCRPELAIVHLTPALN